MRRPKVLVLAWPYVGALQRATLDSMAIQVSSEIQGVRHLSILCGLVMDCLMSVNRTSSRVGTVGGRRGSCVRRPR